MEHYNSSSARVLVTPDYQPTHARAREEKQQLRLKVVNRKRNHEHFAFINLKNIAFFIVVVSCICTVIYNQVQLNEINGRINSVNSEITELQSEYVKMKSGLESTLSIKNVTKQAEQELGMQRLDQYQVVHVRIYEEDKVEINNDSKPESFSEEVETFAASLAKYFKNFSSN